MRWRHEPPSRRRAAPPVALRVGRDEGTKVLRVVAVEALDGDVVGVPVRRLYFVNVEPRGKK